MKFSTQNTVTYTSILLSLILVLTPVCFATEKPNAAHFEPTIKSLKQFEVPEWFKDAKFGIYAHWGVPAVPAYNSEWYPKRMYSKGSPVLDYHTQTYGHPSEFGYSKLIPLFKAENFDPDEWADLYEKAGAKFAGPVAEHHDGFSMWNSKVNRWNAADMGPKRDIVGEMVTALRKKDFKIITSFHHALNILNWYPAMEGTESADPEFGDLYGKFDDQIVALDRWKTKVKEVIDQYQPDQLWFDIGLARIPEEYKLGVAAYYYNQAEKWGKEVLITKKRNDLPDGMAVLDIERGKMEGKADFTWQTDDSIAVNSWGYIQGLEIKPASELVYHLIDIVSKNGVLLLNVCPKGDGTIPQDQKEVLLKMGDWLSVNGEAIYGTRAWITHGEGPNLFSQGGTNVRSRKTYTHKDIRFTKKENVLYAIIMGWPNEAVILESVRVLKTVPDAKVSLLGYDGPLKHRLNDNQQLVIAIPQLSSAQRPCEFAYTLKLEGFDIAYHPDAIFADGRAITLTAAMATLEGGHQGFNMEGKQNPPEFIRFMSNSKGKINWLVEIQRPGHYAIRVQAAPFATPDNMVLEMAGKSLRFEVPKTSFWKEPAIIDVGEVEFTNIGVQRIVLHTDNPQQLVKQTMAVWEVQLGPLE